MKLRNGLFLLVAGTTIPVLLLALVLGAILISHERETFRRLALDRNRAVLSAVDAAIEGHVSTLQALSVSSNLASGSWERFESRLERILRSQPDWLDVTLSAPDGRRLVVASHVEQPASYVMERESLERAVRTREAAVGPLSMQASHNVFGIAIRYPVLRPDGSEVAYVLNAIVNPAQFQRLLDVQGLPRGWASGLVDQHGTLIARVPPKPPGTQASADYRAAISSAREGWYRGKTIEGVDTFTAFLTSARTGWSVGLAIPAHEVLASSRQAVWTLAGGTLAALLVAVAFAVVLGRKINRPVAHLAAAARALGSNDAQAIAPVTTRVDELRQVGTALTEAAAAIAERQTLRDREQQALREADRAKDEFIAVLGHELRNPLSAIASSVLLMRSVPQGSKADTMAREIIQRQTAQMSRLVEDLLDMSRLATGRLTLKREPFDLAQAVRGLVAAWEQGGRLQAGRVRLETAEAVVDGDRARVEQVAANLLDNATKFSPPDRPIHVRVFTEDGFGVLEVRDEGEGLAPELLPNVFAPFVQGAQERHRPRGGLGLGLSVVQRLAELHGGRVSARSAGPGEGATFTVRLPLARGAGSDPTA